MVLQGLRATSLVAWLSGIFYSELPFGTPAFTSWSHPVVVYHFTLTIIKTIIWIDYTLHYNETFGADLPIRQIITKVFTYLTLLFTVYLRVCFLFLAKRIARILNRIETQCIFSTSTRRKVITKKDLIILHVSFVVEIFAAGTFAAAVAIQRKRGAEDNSWFALLSKFEYFLLYFVLGTLPIAATLHLAFAFSIVLTKYLICFYQEFCSNFEAAIDWSHEFIINGKIPKIAFQPPSPSGKGVSGRSVHIISNDRSQHVPLDNIEGEKIKQRRPDAEILLKQMDFIFEMFEEYDNSMGPLFLGLVLSLIMLFIQTCNAIMIFDLSDLFYAFNWLCLVALLIQLVLVIFNTGHAAHKLISEKKLRLRRKLVEMPNVSQKNKLNEMIEILENWQWKMSAAGFFVIDRNLVPGIVSIMMSYIMILFQLQLSTRVGLPLPKNSLEDSG